MAENAGGSYPVTGDARGIVNLFGKYEVEKLLGCGAFAKVYHARDVRTGQSVAVKAVNKQKVLKGGFTGHVKREISILRRLRHPHIVKIFEVLATKSKIYFVLEFAKCGELFSKVARGRLSEDLSRRYFQQLISAVGFCHARGVFHRDLKPENLLLDENSDLKVSDFGLSAVQEQVRPEGLLHTVCGTPAYVAPEILAKKGYVGARVDVWSCGIILFVLVAGYLPFNDTNLIKMYRKIYTGKFRCPIWTSPELRRLLSRLLDTNPETRITIDEILRDPWFRKDCRDINSHLEDIDLKNHHESGNFLNAFGIISFSSGLDLSGLFDDSDISVSGERFVSAESPEHIIERVAEAAMAENVIVKKKEDWGAKLEGRNGNFAMIVEIYRLNDELVLVEVKQKEICVGLELVQEIWKHKLRPKLDGLIYQLKTPVVSDE